jgi:Tfp pilus assembly protein PilE
MDELFTSMTKGERMSKVILNLGYRSIVLDADKAVAMLTMLEDAEMYESKYHSKTDVMTSHNTYHIYPMTQENAFNIQLITNESYNMYKLAGKPNE